MSTFWTVYPDAYLNLPVNWIIDERVEGRLTRSSGGRTPEDALIMAGQRARAQGLSYLGGEVHPQGFVLEFAPIDSLTSA